MQLQGVNVSNGIGWSPDGARCYYIDTPTQRLDWFSFDPEAGHLGERRTLAEVEGVPDGLAVDADGCIWVAFCGQWEVRRFTPAGRVDRVVRLPGSHVTTCSFGGADLSTLFIAVSARDLDEAVRRRKRPATSSPWTPGHRASRATNLTPNRKTKYGLAAGSSAHVLSTALPPVSLTQRAPLQKFSLDFA